jgi:hypothetical protein
VRKLATLDHGVDHRAADAEARRDIADGEQPLRQDDARGRHLEPVFGGR